MKRMISTVSMVPFIKARNMAEANHHALSSGKVIHEKLTLSPIEEASLEELSHCCSFTASEKTLYQKLLIKKNIYTGINSGKFTSEEIDFIDPLEEDVKNWAENFGYALSPKPNTIWITASNGWQYESNDSPPPSKTIFTILW